MCPQEWLTDSLQGAVVSKAVTATYGGPAIGDRVSGACGHTSQGDGGGSVIVWRGVGRIGVRRVVGDLDSHSDI